MSYNKLISASAVLTSTSTKASSLSSPPSIKPAQQQRKLLYHVTTCHITLTSASAVLTSTSTKASSVRVLPVPGGPCHSVRLRTTAWAMALRCNE
jgi:hypothetical protein